MKYYICVNYTVLLVGKVLTLCKKLGTKPQAQPQDQVPRWHVSNLFFFAAVDIIKAALATHHTHELYNMLVCM